MLDAVPIPQALGEYDVVRRIGRGGMGQVLEVRARKSKAVYAAKLLLRRGEGPHSERFRREAELIARCDRHAGIVKVHAFGETPDGLLYLIMDLVEGESLESVFDREAPMAPERAASIGREVANALAHAHGLGIVHRDVKPSNVLVAADGSLKLTDFGLATAPDVASLTKTGTFVGTLRYSAPEQVNAQPAGPAADVFALGCVLHQAITGRTPLEHLERPLDVVRVLNDAAPIASVRSLAPDCPEPLAAIIDRALRKSPDERYPSGAEIAFDLGRFLAGSPVSRPRAKRPARRERPVAAIAFGVTAVAVIALAVLVSFVVRARFKRAEAVSRAENKIAEAQAIVARRDSSAEDLARAIELARKARGLAGEATEAGAPNGREIERGARASQDEASAALAERHLEQGRSLDALDVLTTLWKESGELSPDATLVQARARFVCGTLAPEDAAAVGSLALAPPRHAQALELAGDFFRARGESARACALYGGALDVGSREDKERRRIKHGVTSIEAGDERSALADLALLVPDLAKLPSRRDTNAALAGFAPALYRRAMAVKDLAQAIQALELAGRLAPPPPELAPDVAKRWLAVAESGAREWNVLILNEPSPASIEKIKRAFVAWQRAREADPACDSDVIWEAFQLLSQYSTRGADPARVETTMRACLADAPDDPLLLGLLAWSVRRAHPERPPGDVLAIVREAIERFPAPRDNEHSFLPDFAFELGNLLVTTEAEAELPLGVEHLRKITRRDERVSYALVARYRRMRHEPREALEALDSGPLPAAEPRGAACAAEERMLSLLEIGRVEEAARFAKSIDRLEVHLREQAFNWCTSNEQKLRAAAINKDGLEKLRQIGTVQALLGKKEHAQKTLERLRQLGATREADELSATISRVK